MTFLGVKLHAVNISGVYSGSEHSAIISQSKNIFVFITMKVVRVQKIKTGDTTEIVKQAVFNNGLNIVPTHVRKMGIMEI